MIGGEHFSGQAAYGRDLAFWQDFGDPMRVRNNPNLGIFHEWYGYLFPTFASATAQMGWISYQDTGGVIAPLAAATQPPVLRFTTDGTDEDEVWLQLGDGTNGGLVYLSATENLNFDTWVEYVFKADRITTSAVAYYLGLAAQGGAAANFVADSTGVIQTTLGHIGFSSVAAAPSVIRGVYVTGSGSLGTPVATAHTLVADTWTRLGLRYRRATGKLEYWAGSGTTPATLAGSVAISTSGFPDAVNMTPIVGFKSTTATATNLDLHCIRYGLLYNTKR